MDGRVPVWGCMEGWVPWVVQWEDLWALQWAAVIKDGVDQLTKAVMVMDRKVDIKDGVHRGNGEVMEEEDQEPVTAMALKVDRNKVDTTTGIGEDQVHKEVLVVLAPTVTCTVEVQTPLMEVLLVPLHPPVLGSLG